jgi:hypothetical protein
VHPVALYRKKEIKTPLYATISAAIMTDPLVLHAAVLFNIFIHVIPEDGPYGPKHVVSIIRA